jgi:hypothetical protein
LAEGAAHGVPRALRRRGKMPFVSPGARILLPLSALAAHAVVAAAPVGSERLVHRFLEVRISPDATHVADVEGDTPDGSYYPDVRELVIRLTANDAQKRIVLPCGHVPECWPGSLAWTPDGKRLSFTLRSPGTHEYALYNVAADGSGLTRLLAFKGTLEDLKYASDGTLAMLAVENARKEVGATQAGAPVAGDLASAPAEQRIATLEAGSLHWASPPELFVYEYDWRPGGRGFVGTAAPGDGDDNWWTARLYAFAPGSGAAQVIYTPASIRQQLAAPAVSPDGGTVAFIAGLMSDFGSTGGDVYSLALDGGAAVDLTPGIKASATALHWSCDAKLHAELLAGDRSQIVDLGSGRAVAAPRVLWSGPEALEARDTSLACPSGARAVVHESFTAAPEIEVGTAGSWRDLTSVNAGLRLPARVRSLTWTNEGFTEQGWLLLPAHDNGKLPLVTIVHGGPAAAAVPYFRRPAVLSAMLGRGWAVFMPNPRGSFGQGERFTLANVRDFGYGDLRDILVRVHDHVGGYPEHALQGRRRRRRGQRLAIVLR